MKSFDEVNRRFYSDEEREKIASLTIGIAGSGGLGSNCAMMLVRAGFTKFVLVDFDVVEASNLNRQFYFADQIGQTKVETLAENLKRINFDVTLKTHVTRVTKENISEIFGGCDIVVEAFDDPESKADLTTHYLTQKTPYVCVSGIAGFGNVDRIVVREIGTNSWLVGDGSSGIDKAPPLSPAVMVAAGKEADIVLTAALTLF